MKSLIPVLLTLSLTLTMKAYVNAPASVDVDIVQPLSTKVTNQTTALATKDTITLKLKKCDWELVKTAVVPFDKGLNLSSPHFLSNYPVGDLNWISNEGLRPELPITSIRYLQLGVNDIQRFNWEGFNTSELNTYPTATVLQHHLLLPGQIPAQGVLAYQAEDGNYYLVKIKAVTWGTTQALELSVYHAV
ncbi:hypothetical protein [Dyadobacter sp. MSC1_007]|jgi:hypothetical protein|uniref:hypothetical protein n=1 Tax=Dyadobacter sp. MSC1_007 TaxID=2909264 RepID=UPI00202EAD07|nr:hypothetical protein [Dyadobacter sp. MSC1_007]